MQPALAQFEALYQSVEIQASGGSEPSEERPCEEHIARVKRTPAKPSSAEVVSHEATHCPFRSWCKVCVAANAREDPHPRRRHQDEESGFPMVSMDYSFLRRR